MAAFGKYTHPKLKKALARRRHDTPRSVEQKGATNREPPTETILLEPSQDESKRPGKG